MPSTATQRDAELAFHRAIGGAEVAEVARLLAEGVDPNCFGDKSHYDKYAFTALCVAIDGVRIAREQVKVRALLTESAPGAHLVPFDSTAARANCLEIIRCLLAAGADPNLPTHSRTPLSLAVFGGDSETVQLLLDAGADPAGKSWSPYSKLPRPKGRLAFYQNAIHGAAEKGFTDIVRLLCRKGADPSARDHQGKTALAIARKRGHVEVVAILEQYERASVQ